MSALQKLKAAVGLDTPPPDPATFPLDLEAEIAALEHEHAELYRERQEALPGSPARVAEIDQAFNVLNAKLDAARAAKRKADAAAQESERTRTVREAVERGRKAAKAKPPSDAAVVAARKALEAARSADTKAQELASELAAAGKSAGTAADEAKRAYETEPSDDAWASYEKARSKAERASIDAGVASQRAQGTARALAEAERAAAVADYEYKLATSTQPIDDALAAEAIQIVGRAVAWFMKVRERQHTAYAERVALWERGRALGLDPIEIPKEFSATAYDLARVAIELWASASHAAGEALTESTTASASRTHFEAAFVLRSPPAPPGMGGGSETGRVAFNVDTIERAARALAR